MTSISRKSLEIATNLRDGKRVERLAQEIEAAAGIVDGDNYFGDYDAGNYVKIDSSGNMSLSGDATVWDDLRFPIVSLKLGGVNDPNFVKVLDDGLGSTGLYAYAFDKTAEEEVFFAVQFPHKRKSGSNVRPHVHWMPTGTDTGDVVWGLEYSWANINAAFGNSTIITVTQTASGTVNTHQMALMDAITGTGKTSSSMMLCRVFRDATNVADTYDEDAALIEVDFHIEIDKMGDQSLG